jgi:hypothetical protein
MENIFETTANQILLYMEFVAKFNSEVFKRLNQFTKKLPKKYLNQIEQSKEHRKLYEEKCIIPAFEKLKIEHYIRKGTFQQDKDWIYPELSFSITQLQKFADDWNGSDALYKAYDNLVKPLDLELAYDNKLFKEFLSLLNIDQILLEVANYIAGVKEKV